MRGFLKFIGYFIFVAVAIVVLAPKRHLYDFAQQEWVKQGVIVSGERAKDNPFSLELNGGDVYLKDVLSANFEQISLWPFLIFNQIKIKNLKTSKEIENIFAITIEKGKIDYLIFNPLKANIAASGDFGDAEGFIDFKERKIFISIVATQKFEAVLKKFPQVKKEREGFYIYESSY